MRRALKHTQMAVILSLDVIKHRDNHTQTITPLWLNLTPILFWLLGVSEFVASVVILYQAVSMALSVYGTWFEILGKSLLFGGAVIAQATADDVRGKHVYGVLPMWLSAEAASVVEVYERFTSSGFGLCFCRFQVCQPPR